MMTIATMDWIAGMVRRADNGNLDPGKMNSLVAESGFTMQWIDRKAQTVEVRDFHGDVHLVDLD